MRASAENVDRALLLGIPVRRLSTIVWLIAGGLAALTFMLQAPFAGVKPGVAANGPTVLLPLLAAAVIARMESLPLGVRRRDRPRDHGADRAVEHAEQAGGRSTSPTSS